MPRIGSKTATSYPCYPGHPWFFPSKSRCSPSPSADWAWDFDSDGVFDSTEENPTAVFAEAGTYSVTLTVSGPDGQDTTIAVGFITASLPSLAAPRLLLDQTVELTLSAQAGRSYEIQASPDLATWTTIADLATTNATTILHDSAATNFTQRFYRVVIP